MLKIGSGTRFARNWNMLKNLLLNTNFLSHTNSQKEEEEVNNWKYNVKMLIENPFN